MRTNVNSTIYFSVLFYFLLIFLVCKYLLLFSQLLLCELHFKFLIIRAMIFHTYITSLFE